MGWLPFENEMAWKSEELILKYNQKWTGCKDTIHPVMVPSRYLDYFTLLSQEQFRVDISFTREGWHGRMKACRAVGASMKKEKIEKWEEEHWKMLESYPEEFSIPHYVSIAHLKKES